MKSITSNYSDLLRQHIRCTGTITNLYNGITIELETKDYITKEEFFINFLNKFRSSYDIYANEYNQKEYKKLLKEIISDKEKELEQLKFAYKVCGRDILE